MNFVVVVDVNLFLTILRKCKLNFVSSSEERPYFCSIVLLLSTKIIQTTKLICQLLECKIFTHHVYRYGKKICKIQIRVQRPSVTICLRTSVLDPGCSPGTRILIFHLYGSCISGPGSYNTNKRRGEQKNLFSCLFCSQNLINFKISSVLILYSKKILQIH